VQLNDNLIWTHGRTVSSSRELRRLDVSDYDLGEGVVPTVIYNDLAQFTYGAASTATAGFPITQKEVLLSATSICTRWTPSRLVKDGP